MKTIILTQKKEINMNVPYSELKIKNERIKKIILPFVFLLLAFSLQSCVVHTRPAYNNHAKVVYVKHAPKNHKIVVVKGKRYYYWNGKHYNKTKKGFVVVKIR